MTQSCVSTSLQALPDHTLARAQIFHPLSLLIFQPSQRLLDQIESFETKNDWNSSHVISLQVWLSHAYCFNVLEHAHVLRGYQQPNNLLEQL